MPDQPDETQKQQRRSAALPPFFAPRTTRPTTPAQSGTATPPPRRASQLFTPPGVQKQRPATPPATPLATPLAPRRATPFSAPLIPAPATEIAAAPPETPAAPPAFESMPSAPEAAAFELDAPASEPSATFDAPPDLPNAEPTRDPAPQQPPAPQGGDAFVIEQFEQAPIALRATGDHGAVQGDGTLSFQVFDDASRLLERGAPPASADAAGSIEIERTEVTFEPASGDSRLEVESFWATEAMQAHETPRDGDAAGPLGMAPAAGGLDEAETAAPPSMDRDTQPMLDAIEQSHEAMPVPSWLEDVPSEPVHSASDAEPTPEPAPLAASAPEAEPEPVVQSVFAPAPMPEPAPPPEPAMADDAEEALADAFSAPAPNETVPRWATPRASRAVTDDDRPTQPNDGWNFAPPSPPPDELAAALAWPDSGLRAPTPARGVPATGEADRSHELAASAEGWPLSVGGRPGVPDAVATALERIAQRVRAGDVPLPADVALAKSDESALALTLAALLRVAAAPRA